MISLIRFVFMAALLFAFEISTLAMAGNMDNRETDLCETAIVQIVNHWSGDYPVARLDRLPEGQRDTPAGFIDNPEIFRGVWQAFKSDHLPLELDFDQNIVIFVRNVTFFNRMRILKVTLTDGIADIVTMETSSALPIEEHVAIALVEIPKRGILAIRTGAHLTPMQLDPSNIAYRIEGKDVHLINGRSEKMVAPGFASKTTTSVLGTPAVGNLNDDGHPDAALILFQNARGTGTFIYVAAAINYNDGYHGTNAVFLGDRISIIHISIRNGVIVVKYRDRRPDEPMTAEPSVDRSAYFILDSRELLGVWAPEGQDHVFERRR